MAVKDDANKLLPCIDCDGTSSVVFAPPGSRSREAGTYAVVCLRCQIEGPAAVTVLAAVKAWNLRRQRWQR